MKTETIIIAAAVLYMIYVEIRDWRRWRRIKDDARGIKELILGLSYITGAKGNPLSEEEVEKMKVDFMASKEALEGKIRKGWTDFRAEQEAKEQQK